MSKKAIFLLDNFAYFSYYNNFMKTIETFQQNDQ